MSDSKSKPMPRWFAPALIISGLLTFFGFLKQAKGKGLIKEEEKP